MELKPQRRGDAEGITCVGAALAANNLADRDKFAAKAAPTPDYICGKF